MYSDLKKGEYKNYSVGYTLIKFYTPFSIKEILQISSKMGQLKANLIKSNFA